MKSMRITKNLSLVKAINNHEGFILIAALTLMATLILVGVTTYIVSSSNVKVSANFKTSQTALQVAMAGAEKAREALRAANASSTTASNFTEELVARVGANNVLNGYTSTTDDVAMATGTMSIDGKTYTYNAYLTNDSTDGSTSTTDSNGRAVITSVATGPNSAKASVTTTVRIYTLSGSSPATLYSKDNTTLSGSAININGIDAGSGCGGSNKSAVYVYSDPATGNAHTLTENGGINLIVNSPNPDKIIGPTNLDLQSYIDNLQGSATVTVTADASGSSYGSASGYAVVYSDATQQADHELTLNNVTGYGILLVKGDLRLAGNIDWHGIIIATGVVTTSGVAGNTKNIQGQVYSGSSSLGDTTVTGGVTIGYNSCEVKKSLASQPLTVVNWKQN